MLRAQPEYGGFELWQRLQAEHPGSPSVNQSIERLCFVVVDEPFVLPRCSTSFAKHYWELRSDSRPFFAVSSANVTITPSILSSAVRYGLRRTSYHLLLRA